MKRVVLPLLYSVLMRTFLRVIVGVHFRNRDVIRKQEQFIMVANHNSHLDTMCALSAIPWRMLWKTHPIAAGDYFGQSPIKAFFTRFFVNAILIPRSRPKEGEEGPDPIKLMMDQIDRGHSLILFPEGSRGEPEKFQKFKRGIGILLEQRPNVVVIPAFMKGLGKALGKGHTLLIPTNSVVIFGEPEPCKAKDVEGIVHEVEAKIRSLDKPEPADNEKN
jgi:1-acyl-sn-glycerol-3-phosphate acyltransferase